MPRARREKGDALPQHGGENRQDDIVDEAVVEHDRVYLSAAYQPNVLAGLFLQGAHEGGDVARDEPHVVGFGRRRAPGENVVGLVRVGELVDGERELVGGPVHQGRVDRRVELRVAVVITAAGGLQPIDLAVGLGDVPVQAHGNVEPQFSHATRLDSRPLILTLGEESRPTYLNGGTTCERRSGFLVAAL